MIKKTRYFEDYLIIYESLFYRLSLKNSDIYNNRKIKIYISNWKVHKCG